MIVSKTAFNAPIAGMVPAHSGRDRETFIRQQLYNSVLPAREKKPIRFVLVSVTEEEWLLGEPPWMRRLWEMPTAELMYTLLRRDAQ